MQFKSMSFEKQKVIKVEQTYKASVTWKAVSVTADIKQHHSYWVQAMFIIVSLLAQIHFLLSWHPRTRNLLMQLEEKNKRNESQK